MGETRNEIVKLLTTTKREGIDKLIAVNCILTEMRMNSNGLHMY